MKKLFLILFIFFIGVNAQEYERNILIEVFTNSHCPLCPAAHNAIDAYLANGAGADRVRYMYYHMVYPYSDDQLNQYNTQDPAGRNQYYGPYSSTPRGFFDGQIQSNNYNMWEENIDARLAQNSTVDIALTGTKEGSNISLNADLLMNSSTPAGDFVIHFVVVEDVSYNGRNGINNHKNVVREMITPPDGESISVSDQTVTKDFTLDGTINTDNATFIVFVQDNNTQEVYQSSWIDYNELGTTSVEDDSELRNEFVLYQNYPNPFNPTTVIKFNIANGVKQSVKTSLKIYDVLGTEVKTLLSNSLSSGTYEIEFDASDLPSGIYFYRLTAGSFTAVRKLTLLK